MNYISTLKSATKISVILLICSQALNSSAIAGELIHDQNSSAIKTDVIDLVHSDKKRPIKVDLWHKESRAKNASKLNVAILSHGAMGSSKDYSWLAYPLAAQGWIVIGLNHFGESWRYGRENIDPSSVMRFWQRTEDASFVIDSLDTLLPKHLTTASANIVVIGHSSGGYTAAGLAGVHLDFNQMYDYCTSSGAQADLGCSYGKSEKPLQASPIAEKFNFAFDNRVTGIIMLDPAMGPAATEVSLNKVKVPTLIIGSQQNDFLPFERHAEHYANNIPLAELVTLNNGEGHFVYINSCDNNYKARGVSLCEDRQGVNRGHVHQKLLGHILKFLTKNSQVMT